MKGEGGNRHTHKYTCACARTHLHPPPITVMTLTFLFVMVCVGNVYLWEGGLSLAVDWLPACPSTHTQAHTHTHTRTQQRLERGNRGVSLLRRLSAPCSQQHSNHNTIHLLTASAVPCDWDTSGSGRKEGIRVVCMHTHALPPHWETHTHTPQT